MGQAKERVWAFLRRLLLGLLWPVQKAYAFLVWTKRRAVGLKERIVFRYRRWQTKKKYQDALFDEYLASAADDDTEPAQRARDRLRSAHEQSPFALDRFVEGSETTETAPAKPDEAGEGFEDKDLNDFVDQIFGTNGGGLQPAQMRDENDDGREAVGANEAIKNASGFPYEDRDEDDERQISVSTREAHAADALTDAQVVPPPYRSDRKHVDTEVRGYWEKNPNADDEIQELARTPIVDRHIRTIIEHLITSRPQIKGPEDQADIVRQWFEVELEIGSNFERGLNRFVSDIAGQMLRYGSAAIVKQRTRSGLADDPYEDPVRKRKRQPVWGYMVPDMSTLQVFLDKKGRPRKWRQDPQLFQRNEAKTYAAENVHLAELPTRNSAMYFWTPSLITLSIYPIEVLRDLQERIESHTKNIIDIPSYATVGDKDYLDGQINERMLNRVAEVIQNVPRGAMPVLPWFVEVTKQESQEYIEQLKEAAKFWEQETRRGIGGSKLQDGIGDSGTRNTSEVLISKEMRTAQSIVPEIQRAFRWLAVDKLMEKGVDVTEIGGHDDMVALEFEDIDMHKQIRREEHYNRIWQNDGYQHGEFREKINEDPDTSREEKYFSEIKGELGTEAETESQQSPGGSPRPKNKNK